MMERNYCLSCQREMVTESGQVCDKCKKERDGRMSIKTYPTRGKLAVTIAIALAVYAAIAYAVLAAPPIQHKVQPMDVTWDAPVGFEDGTSILTPISYRVYWGRQSHEYTDHVLVTTGLVATVEINATGAWYVAATALVDGLESDYSNELVIHVRRSTPPGKLRRDK